MAWMQISLSLVDIIKKKLFVAVVFPFCDRRIAASAATKPIKQTIRTWCWRWLINSFLFKREKMQQKMNEHRIWDYEADIHTSRVRQEAVSNRSKKFIGHRTTSYGSVWSLFSVLFPSNYEYPLGFRLERVSNSSIIRSSKYSRTTRPRI